MGLGFENALNEITLVLFTTMAPSGVVACLIMMSLLLRSWLCDRGRVALNKFLCIPILVTLVGLVASATHLGNPANALYVLTGVGRSPLSNEVCAAVVFLGLAGSYWFYSFSQVRHKTLERIWVVGAMVAGVVFLVAIAFAYWVSTIPTWSHPLVPVSLVLNACVGGPLLALVGFAAVGTTEKTETDAQVLVRVSRPCIVAAAIGLVANVVCAVAYGAAVMPLSNAVTAASELAPLYGIAVGAFAVACAVGVFVDLVALRKEGRPCLAPSITACVFALLGIFALRFTFYMLHMTVGISF